MNAADQLDRLTPRSRRAFALGLSLGLAVLGLTLAVAALFVRGLIRQQIIQRDAEALYATTLMEQLDAADAELLAGEDADAQIGFDAAILASRLRGVIGIRFFDPGGQFTDSFPANIAPTRLRGLRCGYSSVAAPGCDWHPVL